MLEPGILLSPMSNYNCLSSCLLSDTKRLSKYKCLDEVIWGYNINRSLMRSILPYNFVFNMIRFIEVRGHAHRILFYHNVFGHDLSTPCERNSTSDELCGQILEVKVSELTFWNITDSSLSLIMKTGLRSEFESQVSDSSAELKKRSELVIVARGSNLECAFCRRIQSETKWPLLATLY